ncbi:hypothetical protein BCR35DRAFT_325128 [Leucosporidium creatinivorum]|uniref:Zn(2)-C6 fungal-type domain-containing protein n=1 Tax=Leucosporidium creatinivorum TaxID=106004 RepID=A0A1Y2FBE6_9BASI|nr:hypothetical protein BCR35DRAFT_325128 [Leucosporidium creatinivorum]
MEAKKGAQKVKRAAPAFARTARGCKMCRTRRKKCDERYSALGVCGRCEKGGFQCDGPGVSTSTTPYTSRPPPIAPPSHSALPPLPSAPIPPFDQPHLPPLPPPYPTIFPAFLSTSSTPPSYPHPAPLPLPRPPPPLSFTAEPLYDPPLLADSAYSPSIQSFFDSLQPAVDPSAFVWATSPAPGGSGSPRLSTGSQEGSVMEQGVATHVADSELTEDALQEAQALPIYAALSDAFLTSLPPPVRDIVKRRIMDVAFSNSLSKSASIALCLLYQARSLPDDAGDQARERLIRQSTTYFDRAATRLTTTTAIPLEAQMLATLDLYLHALESNGSAAGYSVLLLADHWVTSSLGRPKLDLTTLEGLNNILFRSMAHIDILRCLCLGGRRTLFDLVGAPGSSPLPSILSSNPSEIISSEACEGTKGVPTGLILCIAATCNLAMEEEGMEENEWRRRGEEIERCIKGWKPVVITPERLAGEEGIKVLDDFATHEMWRYAALIHLYQSIFHYGPLQPSILTSLSQLLTFGSRHSASILALDSPSPSTPTLNAHSHLPTCGAVERACPWFFAATVALDGKDREMCKEALGRGRPETLAQSNLAAAERLWELSDERGWPVSDWRSALAREGRYVAFL